MSELDVRLLAVAVCLSILGITWYLQDRDKKRGENNVD